VTPVFVDTSALYALLVEGDENHDAAVQAAASLRAAGVGLATSSFVVLETVALLQARIGIGAVRAFYLDMLPLMEVVWVDRALLDRAMGGLLAASLRRVSLTDWTSIALMQERGWTAAFAFDEDFARQGVDLIPG